MPRNEDGEFELILGNRQLLSVFFIVVVLLGVFFTMGYIVGRNSAPAAAETARKDNVVGPPIVVDPSKPQAAGEPAPLQPGQAQVTSPEPQAQQPAPQQATAHTEAPKPEPAKAEPPPPAPEPKKPERVEAPKTAAGAPSEVIEPAKGSTHVQVLASGRTDAELIVIALRKKGFSAFIAPGPDEKLFRVLVGPFADAAGAAKSRADLHAAGFKNAFVKRY